MASHVYSQKRSYSTFLTAECTLLPCDAGAATEYPANGYAVAGYVGSFKLSRSYVVVNGPVKLLGLPSLVGAGTGICIGGCDCRCDCVIAIVDGTDIAS